jgi:hypothetical protein
MGLGHVHTQVAETRSTETLKQAHDPLEPRGITLLTHSDFSVHPVSVAPTTGDGEIKLGMKDEEFNALMAKAVRIAPTTGGSETMRMGVVGKLFGEGKLAGAVNRQAIKSRSKKVAAKAPMFYPLTLFFESREQCEEAVAVIKDLPALHQDKRKQSIETAIGFLEDKPEIYNHESLAFHILENASLRNEFMCDVGALTSQEIATLSQSQAKNKAAYAHRLKAENKVFAVEFQGEQRYAAFQFDMETGKPKPIIKDILELVKDEWSGWQLALWFISANGYLDGKTPLEVMDTEPGTVLDALCKETGEVEF